MADLLDAATSSLDGCTQTVFRVFHDADYVPAVAWLPEEVDRPPVVLLGHGGGKHKLTPRHPWFAQWLARHAGAACLAIDAPWHGERAVPGETGDSFHARQIAHGRARTQHQVTAEWLTVLDAITSAGLVDGGRIAYVGHSLGGIFGFPLCAALEDRLACAVLGKVGTTCAPHLNDIASPTVMVASAQRITAPVLFQLQWDDEVFPRQRQLDLFDLIASPGKLLRAHPGLHGDTWPSDEAAWLKHISEHLATS